MQLKGGETSQHNRQVFFAKNNIAPNTVVSAQLVNSSTIQIVDTKSAGKLIPTVDGLITTDPSIYLTLTVADCLPILIYCPGQAVALLHGGWRGLSDHIIEHAVDMLSHDLGFTPSSLSAHIGPGISSHHYPVGDEVANQFSHYPDVVIKEGDQAYLDLKRVAQLQLEEIGIKKTNITLSPVCTFCSPSYFSARRDRHDPVHAMIVLTRI